MGNVTRYREAERRLWNDAGIVPREHAVELARVGTTARVLEVGEGVPVVFFTGGPMAAATWAYVAAAATGVRCLLVERPGTGLSEPLPRAIDHTRLRRHVTELTVDVLDAFGLDRAALVGSSLGGYSVLASAIAHPQRVDRIVLAGLPAFVPGWKQPAFFTLLRTPVIGRLLLAAPVTRASARMSLKQMGEHQALANGRIPAAMIDWTRAWQRDTDTMRNDAATIVACGTRTAGFDPSLDLTSAELASIEAPCHAVVGTEDIVGGEDLGRALVAALPKATLEVWDGAGHLPWLGDPTRFAAAIRSFVAAAQQNRG